MRQEKLDPEEVRRALDVPWIHRTPHAADLADAAAREWLSMRERHQPCHEAPYHPEALRFDNNFTQSWDALKWAQAFRSTARSLGYCDMDEGWLVGWFANAIMRGYDECRRHEEARNQQEQRKVPDPTLSLIDQVLDACNANFCANELTVHRYGKSLYEVTCRGGGKEQMPTLQEALQKVYDNAVRDLKLRHQRDAENLARLDGKLPD